MGSLRSVFAAINKRKIKAAKNRLRRHSTPSPKCYVLSTQPLSTYRLQLVTYRLQLVTYRLQLVTYRLQLVTYRLQLVIYRL
ncbi:MAG: hypothetical protein WCL14_00335 [Bacteroidota bacterium]